MSPRRSSSKNKALKMTVRLKRRKSVHICDAMHKLAKPAATSLRHIRPGALVVNSTKSRGGEVKSRALGDKKHFCNLPIKVTFVSLRQNSNEIFLKA